MRDIFTFSILIGWAITALVVFLVSAILLPEESRSIYFWQRVWWTEFLVSIFWSSVGIYLFTSVKAQDREIRFGGISTTIFILTAIYSILTFAVMILHAYLFESDLGNRIHLVLQIILFAVLVLCIVFLSIARGGATTGLNFDKTKAHSPKNLNDLLAFQESTVHGRYESSGELVEAIKRLREFLNFSFNVSNSLSESEDYQSLSHDIETFCESIGKEYESNEELDEHYLTLTEKINSLQNKAKYIAAKQVN